MKRIILLGIGLCFLVNLSFGQEIWSLERCVNHAFSNNINVKRGELQIDFAELNLRQTEQNRYPGVNFSVQQGVSFGRSIDPITNDFIIAAFTSTSPSISASVNLYEGGRVTNTLSQNAFDIKASEADLEQTKYDIGLQVAQAYLQILLNEEQLANAKVNLKQVNDQLAQMDKLIAAGSLPKNDRLDIVAQVATNDQLVISAQNAVELSYLTLKQLLQIDLTEKFQIEKPEITVPSDDFTAINQNIIYQQALQTVPSVEAGRFRESSATLGIDIARSGLLPTISIGGSVGSNYASVVPNTGFFEQMGNNFNGGLGLSISVPIYDKGMTKIAIQRAELGVRDAQLVNALNEQQVKTDVERAVADAKAAAKQYKAAERSVEALDAAFKNVERKLKLGAANTFEYSTAKNNLDNAKGNLILAKYDYFFKLKILDVYQGKPLRIN